MRRAIFATIAVLLLVAGALAAVRGVPAAALTAADVVARNVAARGGLDAWRKVETMSWAGRIESDHAPSLGMQFELQQKRPNKTRLQINAMGGAPSVRVFDGARGWKVRPSGGQPEVQPYTTQELLFARAGHGIDAPVLAHVAKGDGVALEGLEEVGGRQAYHLSMRLANGAREDVWVDAETWLDVRYDRTAEGPSASARRVSASYGDWRTVEGLKIPFLIESGGAPGTAPDRMRIEKVVLNPPLDDWAFANPASPRPRLRGRPAVGLRAPAPAAAPSAATAATAAAGEAQGSAPP
jgi:hypothetical protein